MSRTSLAFILAFGALAGCNKGKQEPAAAPAQKSAGGEVQMTPDEQRAMFGGLFAIAACKQDGYLWNCGKFEGEADCRALIQAGFDVCANEAPQLLQNLDDKAAEVLGQCTAKRALLTLATEGRLSIEGKCENPESFP